MQHQKIKEKITNYDHCLFFWGFFNVGEVVIQPYEDLAKFDYNLDMKVKIFFKNSIFLATCWNLL